LGFIIEFIFKIIFDCMDVSFPNLKMNFLYVLKVSVSFSALCCFIPAFLGLNEWRKAIKELKKQKDDEEVNEQSIYLFEKSKKLLILFIILFSIVSVLQMILIFCN